jgi:hypothetical protein
MSRDGGGKASGKAMVGWLIVNCLAAALLVSRPQIEDTVWFWVFCLPALMFLRAAYRWIHSPR